MGTVKTLVRAFRGGRPTPPAKQQSILPMRRQSVISQALPPLHKTVVCSAQREKPNKGDNGPGQEVQHDRFLSYGLAFAVSRRRLAFGSEITPTARQLTSQQ
jgi:hypothetical protein